MSGEHARVWVVDDSPAVRETIAVILGADYDVETRSGQEYLQAPATATDADLLIVADDILSAESVSRLAQGPPVLWLRSRSGPPPLTTGPWAAIPRAFTPEDLRANVRALLADRAAARPFAAGGSIIDYPLLPREIVALARRAASTHFPVLICGETGTGKARLARAIHAFSDGGSFVQLSAAGCTRTALRQSGGNLTICVGDIAEVDAEGQQLLLELLDCGGFASADGWCRVRVIGATAAGFEALGRDRRFDKELFYRLSVLPITLPPLRDRTRDIPDLAEHLADTLAHALGTPAVRFSPRAIERLCRYLWFGNLAEFETVLARTVALTPGGVIEAEDLLFGYGRITPRRQATPAAAAHPGREPAASPATKGVDLVINELAHEFKNPMVTIKTVSAHLERLLADEAGREQVARLTGEAVERMDRALENLLQFTRFGAPAPQPASLPGLLSPPVTELAPLLSERRVLLDYRPPETRTVFVDTEQIGYAFSNLFHAVLRDLAEGQTLSIRGPQGGAALLVAFPGRRHVAAKLAEFLEHGSNGDEVALPLGLVFAKTLIERNGGRFDVRSTADETTISVQLPSQNDIIPGNGKTAHPHS